MDFDHLDFAAVDFTKGPQGQKVEETIDKTAAVSVDGADVREEDTQRYYRGKDGRLYRHGRQEDVHYTDGKRSISGESNWVYGKQHGKDIIFNRNGTPAAVQVYQNGVLVELNGVRLDPSN